jgi:hypothetical protein
LLEAQLVNSLLVQSGEDRDHLRNAISALSSCSNVASESSTVQALASSRLLLLQNLEHYNLDQLAGHAQLQATLENALSDSVQADRDFTAWAQDLVNNGCTPSSATDDQNYQAATQPDDAAESEKGVFAGLWDPIAKEFSLPPQTKNSF